MKGKSFDAPALQAASSTGFENVLAELVGLGFLAALLGLLAISGEIAVPAPILLYPGALALLPVFLSGIWLLGVIKRREEILHLIEHAIDKGEFVGDGSFSSKADFHEWCTTVGNRIRSHIHKGITNVLVGCALLYLSGIYLTIAFYVIYVEKSPSVVSYGLIPLGGMGLFWTVFAYFSDRCVFVQDNASRARDAMVFWHLPSATKSFNVFTSELFPDFWGDGRIIEGLKYLQKRRTKLRIYTRNPSDYDDKSAADEVKKRIIEPYHRQGIGSILRFLSSSTNKHDHYMIGTTSILGLPLDMIRVEEAHPPFWARARSVEGIKNHLFFWNVSLSLELRGHLSELESKADPTILDG